MYPKHFMASLSCELGFLTQLPAAGVLRQLHLVLVKAVFTFCFKIPFPTDLHFLQGKPVVSFPMLSLSWQWETINPDIQTLHPSSFGLKRMHLAGYFILCFIKSAVGSKHKLPVHGRVLDLKCVWYKIKPIICDSVIWAGESGSSNQITWLCISWLSAGPEPSAFCVFLEKKTKSIRTGSKPHQRHRSAPAESEGVTNGKKVLFWGCKIIFKLVRWNEQNKKDYEEEL